MTQKEKLVKFINGMKKGYKRCPKTIEWGFWNGDSSKPNACCANGHAALGLTGDASNQTIADELIDTISVFNQDGVGTVRLTYVIDTLVGYYNWTTPDVIKWLQSHADQMN